MNTFIVGDKIGGVLLPLPALIKRIECASVIFWAFREITLRYPQPFGLDVQTFEKLTRQMSLGFIVCRCDFERFIEADFQIIDGCIDAYIAPKLETPSITLNCIDSSQWEITTPIDDIAQQLESRGFKRQLGPNKGVWLEWH